MSGADIEARARALTGLSCQVAILDEDRAVVGSAVLPPEAPVIIGSDAGVTVPITGRADIGRVEVSETRDDGVWVHVADDAPIQAQAVVAGAEVPLRGKLADLKSQHPQLASPVRILGAQTIVRVGPVAVVLNRAES